MFRIIHVAYKQPFQHFTLSERLNRAKRYGVYFFSYPHANLIYADYTRVWLAETAPLAELFFTPLMLRAMRSCQSDKATLNSIFYGDTSGKSHTLGGRSKRLHISAML